MNKSENKLEVIEQEDKVEQLIMGLDKDKKFEEYRKGSDLPEGSAINRVRDFLPKIKQANEDVSSMSSIEETKGSKGEQIEMNLYEAV
ncbi:hypothetical protein E3Q11_01252 [Wallemia mellicola]|nr:hypothetical protein E3Q11_01252 [Wallemia mellicola]